MIALRMRIAIVHYHLRPGGVTRVIQHAVSALRGLRCQVAVLTGYSPDAGSFLPSEVHIVPGLDYPQSGISVKTSSLLIDTLEATAQKALGGPPDIWHFHNHTLGKNTTLSQAVYQMALRGWKLLLQIHDFPEDGRPDNYRTLIEEIGEGNPALLASRLYPQANHVHYATINSRDRAFLCQAGMPESHVHLLPNAIDLGHIKAMQTVPPGESERLFLYPTRALRRKNLGEFIFWSAIARQGDRFATTLAPTSPADCSSYQHWVAMARRLKLPVTFEIGRTSPLPFPSLLASATAIITTSVAEGFGLAFLEPWLVGRPLTGRDLPEITDDFKAHDIHLDGLYRHVLIPRDWIDLNIFRRKIECGHSQWRFAYGRPEKPDETERAFQAAMVDGRIDFGRLDEALQQNVICRLAVSTQMRSEINPYQLLGAAPSQPVIIQNREAICRIYGLDQYRHQLERLYTHVGESGSGKLAAISGEILLDHFLAPDRFYLLRT